MLTRRKFLKGAGAAGGLMLLPSWTIGRQIGPNSRLNVALIGVGGIGGLSIKNLRGHNEANIAAFCDVDDDRAAKWYKEFPYVPRYRDYRVMLDEMDGQIDAVIISTPDHMHFAQSAWAVEMGKHVYCQKPLTRTIWESREIKKLASRRGVVTQMGNQGHTYEGWRLIREWYDAGILGKIEDIYVWTDRPGSFWTSGDLRMPPAQKVPSTLDFPLWLGVAPYQPYNSRFVPFAWRGLRNYGTGACGDMACHLLDVTYSAFDLGYPAKITGNPSKFNDYSWPNEASFEMTFVNGRGVDNRIKLHWYDGGRKPKEVKRVKPEFFLDSRNRNGTFVVGTKETVFTNEYGLGTHVYPRERMVELKKSNALPKATIERSAYPGNPQLEWVKGCLEGRQPSANFDYAGPFTEMCLLGTVSYSFPGREITYIPSKAVFPDCPEADNLVSSLYEYNESFLPYSLR